MLFFMQYLDEEARETVVAEDVDEDEVEEESLDALKQAYDQTIASASRYTHHQLNHSTSFTT